MLDHFIQVNDQRLHVVEQGHGPTLLFVHGFPEFWYAWRAQLAAFADRFRAVAPDMRGFNLSSKPEDVRAYRAKYLVEDLRQLILHYGERAVVVAHDWGGAVAWNLAAQHSQVVEKLVIINAPHPVTFARELMHSPEQQQASAYMNFFRTEKAERVLSDDNFRRLFAMTLDAWRGPRQADTATREAYRGAWSQPGALTGSLNYYRASPLYPPLEDEFDAARRFGQIDPSQFHVRVPTLVIWGEQDQALLPGNLQGLQQHVDDLRIVRVPNASHWIVHEQTELVNQLISNFIEEQ